MKTVTKQEAKQNLVKYLSQRRITGKVNFYGVSEGVYIFLVRTDKPNRRHIEYVVHADGRVELIRGVAFVELESAYPT